MDFPLNTIAELATTRRFGANTTDFMVLAAHRHPTLGILLGTQDQVQADLGLWVESRAHEPHTDKTYEGFFGDEPFPAQAIAANLSIDEARAYEGAAEICRVPHSVPLTVRFEIAYLSQFRGGHNFTSLLKNAVTGATIVDTELHGNTQVLPAMADGDSAILWVKQRGGGKEYQWPDDYAEVTGGNPPGYFTWTHGVTGEEYQYDPIWNIGARPYDETDAASKYLLDLRTAAVADGTTRKNPEWVGYLITYDSSGNQTVLDGTYSCLLIVAGDGTFPQFSNVHADATCPALWAYVPPSPPIIGGVGAYMIDPRLRAVGSFYTDPDNLDLWIGGKLAGRSGEMPCLIHLDSTGTPLTTDTSPNAAHTAICICSRTGNKTINSIVRQPDLPLDAGGILRGLTECDFATLDTAQTDRLLLEHPGGRSLTSLRHLDGTDEWIFAVEVDFASSPLATSSYALGIRSSNPAPVDGPEKLLHSCWAAWAGFFWCIKRNTDESQSLCRLRGSQLEPVKTWPLTSMDARGLVQSGPQLLVWGITPDDDPVMMRISGENGRLVFQTGLDLDRHLWRGDAVPLDGTAIVARESVLFVGPITGEGGGIDGWHISEPSAPGGTPTNGEPTIVCAFWNDVDEAFNFSASDLEDAGFDLDLLPAFLRWDAVAFVWRISAIEPIEPYLERQPLDGDIIGYHIAGTMPYDVDFFGRLCFTLGADGGVNETTPGGGIPPQPGCNDAACVLPNMPVGTIGRVVRYPADDTELLGDVASMLTIDPVDPEAAIEYGRLYPYQWMVVDSDTVFSDPLTTEQLEEFTQRIDVAREKYLSAPARKHIHMVQLLVPDYRPDVLFEPEH